MRAARRGDRHDDARHRTLLSGQVRPPAGGARRRSLSPGSPRADRLDRAGQATPLRCFRPRGPPARRRRRSSSISTATPGGSAPTWRDTTAYLLDAAEAGKRLLFEGAQGALLDVDHGTFPFVTSSNSSGAGVSAGSGVPGRYITKVVGVVKAYCTRVGGGPFPTEQDNAIGEQHPPPRQRIRHGDAAAAALRLVRRCRRAVRREAQRRRLHWRVMLLDVLDELPELKICTAYEIDGQRRTDFPSHVEDLRRAVPVYETLPGWQQPISAVERIEGLPANARTIYRSHRRAAGPAGGDDFRRARPPANDLESKRADAYPSDYARRSPRERLPRHVAVIMDGNGRWANQRGLPRIEGHRAGVTSVRRVTEEAARLGHRATDALLPVERELEAAGRGARFPDAAVAAVPGRGTAGGSWNTTSG